MDTNHSSLIRLHPADNVAVKRGGIENWNSAGMLHSVGTVPKGHKVALKPIPAGAAIIKYGQFIGVSTREIATGEHVHTHNMLAGDIPAHDEFGCESKQTDLLPEESRAQFHGFLRSNGKVGTRNYIAVISSVNCSATVSQAVARHFKPESVEEFPNVDGVIALTHGGGCAISIKGEGYRYLTRTLAGYALNPNVGGVLMVGLGCETNQISEILRLHGLSEGPTLRTLQIQDTGGTRATIAAGIEAVNSILEDVNLATRTPQPASAITVGLECGGSDGYSGISANPALGYASDILVRNGGTVVLAETPEIYGAEHLLLRRAASPEIANKLIERIRWWKDYTMRNGAEMDNNPSHGNKAGGLTTIAEKSLGAVTKSGSSRLEAVYEYAEIVSRHGFVFMDTPGYDPIAVTGQVAGGCNLIAFTTGRGSTAGYKPVPCIKLATNTEMFTRMRDDMDLDCGGIVTGLSNIEEVGEQIFQKILAIASGARSRSEEFDYGDNEFVPWQVGPIL